MSEILNSTNSFLPSVEVICQDEASPKTGRNIQLEVPKPIKDEYLPLVKAIADNNRHAVELFLSELHVSGEVVHFILQAMNLKVHPMLHAVEVAQSDALDFLLQCYDVNSKDHDGYTALHCAAINGRTDIVANLVRLKADVNAIDSDGDTPLHVAALNGHIGVAASLLERGALKDCHNMNNETALDIALENQIDDMIQLLQGNWSPKCVTSPSGQIKFFVE